MPTKPEFGNWLSVDELNSLDNYLIATMEEPWQILEDKIDTSPSQIINNMNMDEGHLEELASVFKGFLDDSFTIVGIGGGTACDTAKFLTWYLKENMELDLDLILMPSIISVDAFLCSSIAVREDNKVKYIGESNPRQIIIDYNLIRTAPKFLNRAGVSDTVSITSALGDWKIANEENGERLDQDVFNRARKISTDLISSANEIGAVSEKGIKAMVDGFYEEVVLCEEWGNARPEEGSEHFLAYCLESITGGHYIHGNLIGMNILISLYLQEQYAEFSLEQIKTFFQEIKVEISPEKQQIALNDITTALKTIKEYVKKENLQYSVYNSPNLSLDDSKIGDILDFLKSI